MYTEFHASHRLIGPQLVQSKSGVVEDSTKSSTVIPHRAHHVFRKQGVIHKFSWHNLRVRHIIRNNFLKHSEEWQSISKNREVYWRENGVNSRSPNKICVGVRYQRVKRREDNLYQSIGAKRSRAQEGNTLGKAWRDGLLKMLSEISVQSLSDGLSITLHLAKVVFEQWS